MRRAMWLAAACALSVMTAGVAGAAAPTAQTIGCGSVVKGRVVLHSDLTGCAGDGLIVGADHTRIDLNGFALGGTKAAGSVGIRIEGHHDVRIQSSAPFAMILEFEVGIQATSSRRLSVSDITTQAVVFGLRLEHSYDATIRNNNLGFAERVPSCDPATAPAGIRLLDSRQSSIRDNATQLSGYGILLIQSNGNTIRGNGAAPAGSDGNVCSGISLVSSSRNLVADNTATENRSGSPLGGDGIVVDASSVGNALKANTALTNTDDGIDVRSSSTKVVGNIANSNGDLGIESVAGVTARDNKASGNGNPLQCLNVVCG